MYYVGDNYRGQKIFQCPVDKSREVRGIPKHDGVLLDMDVVAHDTPDVEITQEDLDLLRAALEMAITCKEVEVDVAQAEADARADTLRDLVVLQRKMAEGS